LQDRLGALISPDHPLAREPGQLEWKSLQKHAYVSLTTSAGIRRQIEQDPRLSPYLRKPAYQVSSISALCAFVRSGVGVAVLPALIAKDLDKRLYTFRPLARPMSWRNLFLIRTVGRPTSAAALMLIGHLSKRLALLEKTEIIKPNKNFEANAAAGLEP
jgi:DNA-binding transcriptional LysR family regulator